jgi:hypothetical protein
MEPKYLSEYESPFGFHLYDVYEDALLLRCQGGFLLGADTGGDIDLIFLGVEYIELPMLLRGIHISKPRDEISVSLEQRYAPNRISEPGERVYVIESGDSRFHVIASNFWIQVCKKNAKESSLVQLLSENPADRDAYIIEQVKEWYKLK